jgi:protein phosphatase
MGEFSLHQFGAGTHVGNVRDNNEDSFACDVEKSLWVVADGMGGLGFGEVASAISTYTVTTEIRAGHGVNQAIELAHRRIKDYTEDVAMGTNMGTTMVLLLCQGSRYNVFWVGDSRAYLYDGHLSQISVDHSLVQSLIDRGELTQEEAQFDPRKNAVTRALGVQELETVRADSISEKWQPNQKILLCSDGLSDLVDRTAIESVLRIANSDQEKVDTLIEMALAAGGIDNITVVLVSAPEFIVHNASDTDAPNAVEDNTQVPGPKRRTGRNAASM